MALIIRGVRTVDFLFIYFTQTYYPNTDNKGLFAFKEVMWTSVYKATLNTEIILSHFSDQCLVQEPICCTMFPFLTHTSLFFSSCVFLFFFSFLDMKFFNVLVSEILLVRSLSCAFPCNHDK